jgi:hypothetical protein
MFSTARALRARKDGTLEIHSQNVRSALLAYIGNTLSVSDRETFDRRLLEDEEFSRQVDEAEFQLVEAYADRTLAPDERAIVDAWITRSPQRHARAAITAALRASAIEASTLHLARRRAGPVWIWAVAVAACVALLATLPWLHRKPPAPAVVARLNPAPNLQPKATGEDTILLKAQRLRAAGERPGIPVTYRLHVDRATRMQIIVPSAAPPGPYSVDLRQSTTQQAAAPVHLQGLSVNRKNSLSYVEFLLPADSLAKGTYELNLHSLGETYRIQFSVAYAGCTDAKGCPD